MKRALGWIISLIVVGVLLVGAAVSTELVLRQTVPNRIADEIRQHLKLSDDHPVEVRGIEGLLTLQVIRGALDNVTVEVDDAPLGDGMRASVLFSTTSLPTRGKPRILGETEVRVTFDETQLAEVLRLHSRGIGETVTIEGDHLSIGTTVTLFGQRFHVTLTLVVEVREGSLHIEPISIDAGLLELTVEQLRNFPALEELSLGFDVCVADRLPRGVTLESVELSTQRTLTLVADVDPRIIDDESLQRFGTC